MKLPWFKQREPLAPVAQRYLDSAPRSVARKAPLDGLKFVILDAETSGFDPLKDRILSLAAIPLQAGRLRLGDLRSWIVYQSTAAITAATTVHGILPAESATGEPEPAVLAELLEMLSGAVLVGHHIGFDLGMLNAALHRHYRIRLQNPALDTAAFAMRAIEAFRKTGYPGQRSPSLDEVCTLCGIAPTDRHTAPGDTFTTAELFLVLCARLSRRLDRPLLAGDLPIEQF